MDANGVQFVLCGEYVVYDFVTRRICQCVSRNWHYICPYCCPGCMWVFNVRVDTYRRGVFFRTGTFDGTTIPSAFYHLQTVCQSIDGTVRGSKYVDFSCRLVHIATAEDLPALEPSVTALVRPPIVFGLVERLEYIDGKRVPGTSPVHWLGLVLAVWGSIAVPTEAPWICSRSTWTTRWPY